MRPVVRGMKIRAAVLEQFGRALDVQELELAEPEEREVLVRLVANGARPRGRGSRGTRRPRRS